MNTAPAVYTIPTMLGFRVAGMQQVWKAARSIHPFLPSPHAQQLPQLQAAQQPASISTELSHPVQTDYALNTNRRSPAVCVARQAHTFLWVNGRMLLVRATPITSRSPRGSCLLSRTQHTATAFGFPKAHSREQHRIEMTPLPLTLSVTERNPGKEQ